MALLSLTDTIAIPEQEIELSAIRSQGAGGQNVNKVSTAIHLRFDVAASSLPETLKELLLGFKDKRISADGVIVIKAQRFRSQDRNREDAISRLVALIERVQERPAPRIATRPTRSARKRRVDHKTRRGQIKRLRGKPED